MSALEIASKYGTREAALAIAREIHSRKAADGAVAAAAAVKAAEMDVT
jgi:hypothetical protein